VGSYRSKETGLKRAGPVHCGATGPLAQGPPTGARVPGHLPLPHPHAPPPLAITSPTLTPPIRPLAPGPGPPPQDTPPIAGEAGARVACRPVKAGRPIFGCGPAGSVPLLSRRATRSPLLLWPGLLAGRVPPGACAARLRMPAARPLAVRAAPHGCLRDAPTARQPNVGGGLAGARPRQRLWARAPASRSEAQAAALAVCGARA
jgi:hypothetical protein